MNVYDENEYKFVSPPEARSIFMPTGDPFLQFHLPQEVPNLFWRTMQYLFFGFKWEKKK